MLEYFDRVGFTRRGEDRP
ncbi:MAG: SelB C-terminal domain-containing protein [Candidatus Aminicenantes bacterium]|nr:SelB C-terminal domain-containing protein [Candidatus Aminicenantes bacterium]MCK4760224.1 SelB C-terminal domain-containing protein [Candidatus Aminicenantes bacterium]TEU03475.1 MAG: hypothetical protein E3J22_08615 [Candidatus Aminicenantes bacterium]